MSAIMTLTTTPQVGASFTIPAGVTGTIAVMATFEFNNVGAASAIYFGQIAKGSVVQRINYADSPAGTYFNTITVLAHVSVVPGDVINIRAGRDSGSGGQLVSRSGYVANQV